jgi:hypothetical protein
MCNYFELLLWNVAALQLAPGLYQKLRNVTQT